MFSNIYDWVICWITFICVGLRYIYVGYHVVQQIYMLPNRYRGSLNVVQHIRPTYIPNRYILLYVFGTGILYVGYICSVAFISVGLHFIYICLIYLLGDIYICLVTYPRSGVCRWILVGANVNKWELNTTVQVSV